MVAVCSDWMCQSLEVTLVHVLALGEVENVTIMGFVCHVPFKVLGDWDVMDSVAFPF